MSYIKHVTHKITIFLFKPMQYNFWNIQKYLGVCRLAEGRRYRRIDIIVAPSQEKATALLYFTGTFATTNSTKTTNSVVDIDVKTII